MDINIAGYKHFSFDLWLTLIKSNPEFKSRRDALFAEFFNIAVGVGKVSETIRYYDVLCNNMNEKTGLNIDTFEIYYLILLALGVDMNEIDTAKLTSFYEETERLFMEYKPVPIYPDQLSLFNKMANKGKTINILSNTAFIKGSTLRKLMAQLGWEKRLSFQLYSDEVGYSKPNPLIFQLVIDHLSKTGVYQKHEILHIGDNVQADYQGARTFGMNALLLKNQPF